MYIFIFVIFFFLQLFFLLIAILFVICNLHSNSSHLELVLPCAFNRLVNLSWQNRTSKAMSNNLLEHQVIQDKYILITASSITSFNLLTCTVVNRYHNNIFLARSSIGSNTFDHRLRHDLPLLMLHVQASSFMIGDDYIVKPFVGWNRWSPTLLVIIVYYIHITNRVLPLLLQDWQRFHSS